MHQPSPLETRSKRRDWLNDSAKLLDNEEESQIRLHNNNASLGPGGLAVIILHIYKEINVYVTVFSVLMFVIHFLSVCILTVLNPVLPCNTCHINNNVNNVYVSVFIYLFLQG